MENINNEQKTFHNRNIDEIVSDFSTSIKTGLSISQIQENRDKYGSNAIELAKPKKWYQVMLEQFKDLILIVLMISSVVSLLVSGIPSNGEPPFAKLGDISGWENFLLIVAVVLINVTLGTVQTMKSQKSLDALKNVITPVAIVIRDGIKSTINSADLVAGDLIFLEAGNYVPADARIIESNNIQLNESSLTGESEPIYKTSEIILAEQIPVGDKKNMAFSSSLITNGNAFAVVIGVGKNTEIGKISTLLSEVKEKKTPLQRNLDNLAKILLYVISTICLIVFSINLSKIHSDPSNVAGIIAGSLNFSVALAVAVIPEALSSIVIIILTTSSKVLSKNKAILKTLKSVETLGSISVICSDKTGTLTQNKMTVVSFYTNEETKLAEEIDLNNSNEVKLMEYFVHSSDAINEDGRLIGDPTEVALIDFYQKYNNKNASYLRDKHERLAEIPFDSVRMKMSVLINDDNQKIMITKGAIDKILLSTTNIVSNSKVRKITEKDIEKLNEVNNNFADNGYRVLAICSKEIKKDKISFDDEENLTILGLIAMIDPPRPEVIESIKECKAASIKPVMITGDHYSTAVAIATQIGIFNPETDSYLSGMELSKMSQEELNEKVENYSVYARVSPEDKIKIVRAWQTKNKIVSMTGDGVNDAPALKEANIGVAMGITGTEVSKEAASMVLTDDNFSTIITAIKLGRNAYNNIKNVIRYLLTGNIATIFVVITLLIFGLSQVPQTQLFPYSAIQLLFLNLLTDLFPAVSIGFEKAKESVINEKPRLADETFITKEFIRRLVSEAIIIALVVITSFFISWFFIFNNTQIEGPNVSPDIRFLLSSNFSFITLGMIRIFHSFNCKDSKPTLFTKNFYNNKYLWGSLVLGFMLLVFIYFTPGVQGLFFNPTGNEFPIEDINIYFNPTNFFYGIAFAFLIIPIVNLSKYFNQIIFPKIINYILHMKEQFKNKKHNSII